MSTPKLPSITSACVAVIPALIFTGPVQADLVVGPVAPPVKVVLPPGQGMTQTFLRGDANGDHQVDISDAVSSLACLFSGGMCTSCKDAADVNDDGAIDMSDGVYLLNHLFLNGAEPRAPFPDCGSDSTSDKLGCESYPCSREYPIGTIWTRHDVQSGSPDADRVFEYVEERGGRLVWQDGYNVGHDNYRALIFEKTAPMGEMHFQGLLKETLQSMVDSYWSRGWSVRHVDSYERHSTFESQIHYNVIFEEVRRPWQVLYVGLSEDAHRSRIADLKSKGFRPVNVSSASPGIIGVALPLEYTGLWDSEDVGAWELKTNLTSSAYEAELAHERANGLQLAYVDASRRDGVTRFTAIFNSNRTTYWAAVQNQNEPEYTGLNDFMSDGGFKLRFVTGYQNGEEANFAAGWTKNAVVVGPVVPKN